MSIAAVLSRAAGDATLDAEAASGPGLRAGLVISGRYELWGLLGAGGMGLVYEALHIALGTKVAIKVLRPELLRQPDLVSRFLQEGRCMAAVSSDHVVRVLDAGRLENGLPFLVMDRLFGVGILALLKACKRLSVASAVDYALQVCAGLADIHATGLVHLDIKPANLFVSSREPLPPRVAILDFGIARRIEDLHAGRAPEAETRPVGSPRYSSPEQIDEPSAIDVRSDIWSLGVVLFEMLSGEAPFVGRDATEVYARVLLGRTPSLHALRPALDRGLATVVENCLEKNPDSRLSSVQSLAAALLPFGSRAASGPSLPLSATPNGTDDVELPRSARRGRPWSRSASPGASIR